MVSKFMRYNGAAKNSPTRIRHNTVQALLEKGGGTAKHCFRAEPSGENGRSDHIERQTPTGNGEVPGIMHAGCGVQTDPDRNDPVGDDEPEQHAIPPCETMKEWLKL